MFVVGLGRLQALSFLMPTAFESRSSHTPSGRRVDQGAWFGWWYVCEAQGVPQA
jgi:hypothetical protein